MVSMNGTSRRAPTLENTLMNFDGDSASRVLLEPGEATDLVKLVRNLLMRGVIDQDIHIAINMRILKAMEVKSKLQLGFIVNYLASTVSIDGRGRKDFIQAFTGLIAPDYFANGARGKNGKREEGHQSES